jgi:Flp pilus assembly protein TadB
MPTNSTTKIRKCSATAGQTLATAAQTSSDENSRRGDDMDVAATAILLWGSAALLAGGAYWIAGIPGVCIAIGFVIFINFQREMLVNAINRIDRD